MFQFLEIFRKYKNPTTIVEAIKMKCDVERLCAVVVSDDDDDYLDVEEMFAREELSLD